MKRRFESAVSFEVDARSEVTGLKLRTAPEGPLTLVVFKGALPRVKLYADWRSASPPKLPPSSSIAWLYSALRWHCTVNPQNIPREPRIWLPSR